jgi:EmrB/QacA subfamily drug resistance transporter
LAPVFLYAQAHLPEQGTNLSTEIPPYSKKMVLITACLGAFMATMDTSLVSVGLPQIAAFLETSVAAISWVMVAYLLANASLQIVVGRLADLAAPGRLFVTGVILFAVASGLGGLSPSFPVLIIFRVIQGVGAALMLGVAPKLISLAFPEGERGFALGMFSAGFATGVTFGAPLGGLLLTFLSWRVLFFVNPVLGLILLALSSRVWRQFLSPPAWQWRAMDPWGAVILTSTLALFILTLTGIRDHGFGEVYNLLGLALVCGGLALLIFTEQRQPNPLLHKELWLSRDFLLGSFGVLLAFACVMGAFFLLPFFLVQVYGYPPAQVGLMLAVLSMSNALLSFLGGYLADRVGNVRILRLGLTLICVGLFALGAATPQTSTVSLALRLALTGMGLGLFSAPNLNEILRGAPTALMGLAASTNAVLKNLGALLGVIVLVAALGWGHEDPATLASGVGYGAAGFRQAFWLAAGLAALNFLVNLLPREIYHHNHEIE